LKTWSEEKLKGQRGKKKPIKSPDRLCRGGDVIAIIIEGKIGKKLQKKRERLASSTTEIKECANHDLN